MINLDFPYHFDAKGGTAEVSDADYIRDLIEQVLFTSPGERVNRPDFGCGLAQLVFAPNSEELATVTQSLVQGALEQWLGEMIHVNSVQVRSMEAVLQVTVNYTIARTQDSQVQIYTQEVVS